MLSVTKQIILVLVGFFASVLNAQAAGLTVIDGLHQQRAILTEVDGVRQVDLFDGTNWLQQVAGHIWWKESVGSVLCRETSAMIQGPFIIQCRDSLGQPWRRMVTSNDLIASTKISLAVQANQLSLDVLRPNNQGGVDWWNFDGQTWALVIDQLPSNAQIDSYAEAACVAYYPIGGGGFRYRCDWQGMRRNQTPSEVGFGAGSELPRQPIMSSHIMAVWYADVFTGQQGWHVVSKQGVILPTTALPNHYIEAVTDGGIGLVWYDINTISRWNALFDQVVPLQQPGSDVWLDENNGVVYSVRSTMAWPRQLSHPWVAWQ